MTDYLNVSVAMAYSIIYYFTYSKFSFHTRSFAKYSSLIFLSFP